MASRPFYTSALYMRFSELSVSRVQEKLLVFELPPSYTVMLSWKVCF